MKRIYIFATGLAFTMISHAQMSMSDTTATMSSEAPQTQVESLYNTPSESYKAERNALRRGNSFFEKENYHKALEAYDQALQINEGSIRGRYNKAVALLQLQSDDNKGTENDPRALAARIFTDVIDDAKKYDKDIAEKSYYNLGNMAFNDEQYDQSIAMYKSSLRLNPDNRQARENLRLAQLKKQEQEQNQDQQNQNQDQQDQQQQQQQQQQEQQQEQQQQQQQEQPMTQSAQQILQSMQNKENATRRKVKEEEQPASGRPQTDKPW